MNKMAVEQKELDETRINAEADARDRCEVGFLPTLISRLLMLLRLCMCMCLRCTALAWATYNPPGNRLQKFIQAAERGNLFKVSGFLESGVDVNWTHDDFHGQTALHVAAQEGFTDIVQLLLVNGAQVDLQDKVGRLGPS